MYLILAIDDDRNTLKLLETQIKKMGHSVVVAASGREGIELARTGNPDLILLDIMMPYMDGFEVVKQMKKDEITRSIPIIMLTSKSQKEDVVTAMRQGAADYMIKPHTYAMLTQKIDAALRIGRIQKLEEAAERTEHLNLSRGNGTTLISFKTGINDREVLAEARKHGVKLTKILLTHAHIDHAGGTGQLARDLHLPIIGPHPGDQFWIDGIAEQGRMFGFGQCESFVPDQWLDQGDKVQVGFVTGTDFGAQTGTFISRKAYRELYQPFHRIINAYIHRHSSWKTFIHSCGSVADLIPDFIEAGFDILNPVQISAAGMDPEGLKKKWGRDFVFWGGGVDTQSVLAQGTPAQVADEVKRTLDILAPGGGFVFTPVHNVQEDVPAENFWAMWETWERYGVY